MEPSYKPEPGHITGKTGLWASGATCAALKTAPFFCPERVIRAGTSPDEMEPERRVNKGGREEKKYARRVRERCSLLLLPFLPPREHHPREIMDQKTPLTLLYLHCIYTINSPFTRVLPCETVFYVARTLFFLLLSFPIVVT